MNREIKFRIWHKGYKNFREPDECSLHCFTQYAIDPFTGKLNQYVGALGDNNSSSFKECDSYWKGTEIVKESPYVLQQFTGLKDKNGKDIYEGDIVEHPFGVATVNFERYLDGNALAHLGFCLKFIKKIEPLDGSIEVVGNIFENSELINK